MAESRESLTDILSNDEPPKPEPAAEQAADPVKSESAAPSPDSAQQTTEYRQRGTDGKFLPEPAKADAPEPVKEPVKEPPKAEAPKQNEDFTPREKAFLKAMEEERHKRQAVERQLQQRQTPPPEPPKPFNEDPDGALAQHQSATRNAMMQNKLQVADMVGAIRFTDYAQKRDVFLQICASDPRHAEAAMNSPDPAAYAYGIAKQALDRHEWEQAGGAEGMRKKMETELRAKWDAEQADKTKEQKDKVQEQADDLPSSLSDVQGRGIRSAPVWQGPTPLTDILKH